MCLFKKRKNENIEKTIYSKDLFKRYVSFVIGVFIMALGFNIFMVPYDVVYDVGGIALILNKLIGSDISLVIFIGDMLLLILSFILLGKKSTMKTIVGSLLYPLFVKLTEFIIPLVNFGETDTFIIAMCGAIATGLGSGLVFKSGFTTGGTDILNEIVAKYCKMSVGTAMYFTDGVVSSLSIFFFGFQKFLYSMASVFVVSKMADKVILGISNSKTFYIITKEEASVKNYIMDTLSKGVTVIETEGGFTGNREKMLMCTLPTKNYFLLKEGIEEIDPSAFFIIADAYEVHGGSK